MHKAHSGRFHSSSPPGRDSFISPSGVLSRALTPSGQTHSAPGCPGSTYELVLKNGQSYPCISTYMVQKKDDGKYYVMMPSEITDDLSKQAATKYADFMNTQAYKDYTTAYDKFIKKNPGYEEKIAAKLK